MPFLLEEAHELAEAVDEGDRAGLREELGDVLLQVVFHARLAQEIEKDYPAARSEPHELAVQLAHHWHLAGDWPRAGHWSFQAARYLATHDVSQAGCLYEQAIASYDRAADSPEVVHGRIASRAGLLRMSQFIEIPRQNLEALFNEARAMAERSGDLPAMTEVLFSYANEMLHRGDAEAAVGLATQAVQKAIAIGAGRTSGFSFSFGRAAANPFPRPRCTRWNSPVTVVVMLPPSRRQSRRS